MIKQINEDYKLLKLLSEGSSSESRTALNVLYDKYAQDIFKYLMYYTRNDYHFSKDILQDVFLKIFEKAHLFDSNKTFKPWALQIASNLCKNKYKRHELEHQYIKSQNSDHIKPDKSPTESKDLNQAIRNLEWNSREVIILKYKFKMSISEIAQLLDIPEGTVKSRIYYASKNLANNAIVKNLKS